MLKLLVGDEVFDNDTQTFGLINTVELELEHSLVSLSKWEAEYQRPFLSSGPKTNEEILDYLKSMLVTPDPDSTLLYRLSQQNIKAIQVYIDSPQSATTFSMLQDQPGPVEIVTAELIYYWMIAFTIPFEAQHWHLNRLLTLIRICNIKNSKPKQMSRHETALRYKELNARRRAQLNTTG